jgi:Sec-independent protein translocase protein TatA
VPKNGVGKLEKVVRVLGGGLRKVRKVVAGRMAEVRKEFGDEADAF